MIDLYCIHCKTITESGCKGGNLDSQVIFSKLPGLPWAKYSGEIHLPGYSYCGPNTRLDIRLDEKNDRKYMTPTE